ncbi:hypothetical protein BUALT_Bualt03G0129300 [Buddleja alternifolia]|uniref:FAR1 domain-containing protein n=1 Tax=Buddleja alternifolia TaxID=168488 RepID=A0AAV6XU76_9LAMI|nr:hypothetical protein BUALT_Bualt03G0129300 [Buddleja alternifolia]
MRDILYDGFCEILSLLPADLLLHLRCICKGWCNTVDVLTFINLHLHCQFLDSSNGICQLILRGEPYSHLYTLPLESLNYDFSKIIKEMPLINNPFEGYRLMKLAVGSCNGIMLISHSNGHNFLSKGLGYDSVVDDYKIVKMAQVKELGYDSVADDYKIVKIAQVFDPRNRILKVLLCSVCLAALSSMTSFVLCRNTDVGVLLHCGVAFPCSEVVTSTHQRLFFRHSIGRLPHGFLFGGCQVETSRIICMIPDINEDTNAVAEVTKEKYAISKGFSVRKGKNYTFWKSSEIRAKLFLCNKEGESQRKSSKEVDNKQYYNLDTREKCGAQLYIAREKDSPWKVIKFVIEHTHELAASDELHLLKSARKISEAKSGTWNPWLMRE